MSLYLVTDGDRTLWLAYEDDTAGRLYVYVPNTGAFHRHRALAQDYYLEQNYTYRPVDARQAREAIDAQVGRIDGRARQEQLARFRADPEPLSVDQALGIDAGEYQPSSRQRAAAKARQVRAAAPGEWIVWKSYPLERRQLALVAARDLRTGKIRALTDLADALDTRIVDTDDGQVRVEVTRRLPLTRAPAPRSR